MWRRQVVVIAWMLALVVEVIWQAALVFNPALAVQLSVPHLVIWLVLMLQLLWGVITALAAASPPAWASRSWAGCMWRS